MPKRAFPPGSRLGQSQAAYGFLDGSQLQNDKACPPWAAAEGLLHTSAVLPPTAERPWGTNELSSPLPVFGCCRSDVIRGRLSPAPTAADKTEPEKRANGSAPSGQKVTGGETQTPRPQTLSADCTVLAAPSWEPGDEGGPCRLPELSPGSKREEPAGCHHVRPEHLLPGRVRTRPLPGSHRTPALCRRVSPTGTARAGTGHSEQGGGAWEGRDLRHSCWKQTREGVAVAILLGVTCTGSSLAPLGSALSPRRNLSPDGRGPAL